MADVFAFTSLIGQSARQSARRYPYVKKWAGEGGGGQKKTKTIRPGVHLEYSKPTVTDREGIRDKSSSDRPLKSSDRDNTAKAHRRITFSDTID